MFPELKRFFLSAIAALFCALSLSAQTADYIAVNLANGAVTELDAATGAALAQLVPAYKSDYLLLRRVAAGSIGDIVSVDAPYYIGVFELTGDQADYFFPSLPWGIGTQPVHPISWGEINTLLQALNQQVELGGTFIVPTTEQWEFAARARKNTEPYSLSTGGSATLTAADAFFGSVANAPKNVGSYLPNELGLYDMHGNASEITLTEFSAQVLMGGGWRLSSDKCTSASRIASNDPEYSQEEAGSTLRICYKLPPPADYTLTVDGEVLGSYSEGVQVLITAEQPGESQVFASWSWTPSVNLGESFSATAQTTTLTMPATDLELTSSWQQLYTLTVDGQQTGAYAPGSTVEITAVIPTPGLSFTRWAVLPSGVNLGAGFDATVQSTTVTMPSANVTLTSGWEIYGEFLSIYVKGGYYAPHLPVETLTAVPYPLPAQYKDDYILLRRVGAGTFTIGSPENEPGRTSGNFELQNRVTLTADHYISVTEITRAHWGQITTGTALPDDPEKPMLATYSEIRGTTHPTGTPSGESFMALFNALFTAFPAFCDIPTDAEWEILCRGGTAGSWNNNTSITPESLIHDPNLDKLGIYATNDLQTVAGRLPSIIGLYDMHGNAAEWCRDHYMTYEPGIRIDPVVVFPRDRPSFVVRGGSYADTAQNCRSASRNSILVSDATAISGTKAGFRLQITLPAQRQIAVIGGNGSGFYSEGTAIAVSVSMLPEGSSFDRWLVEPEGANLGSNFSVTAPVTQLTVPLHDVTLTATYKTGLLLNVVLGTGGGYYQAGDPVVIQAPQQGTDGVVFSHWRVSPESVWLGSGFSASSASTTVTMPNQGVTLAAIYTNPETLRVPVNVVKGTTATPFAAPGATVTATAEEAPFGYTFSEWTVTPDSITLGNRYSPTGVSFTVSPNAIPSDAITLTANYTLNGNYAVISLNDGALEFTNTPEEKFKTTHLALRRIEPGTFNMGSATNSPERALTHQNYWISDETQHEETIEQAFYIGVYEMTTAHVLRLGGSTTATGTVPVGGITYANALSQATNLTTKAGQEGFTLPTQAQWEYACRAGNPYAYNVGGEVAPATYEEIAAGVAWWAQATQQPVGLKTPNAWGLYDMHGNIEEWTLSDTASAYGRGGSFKSTMATFCRAASRISRAKTTVSDEIGFRMVFNPTPVHRLTVNNGFGSAENVVQGSQTMISATVPQGKRFVRWTGSHAGSLADATAAVTTVTMPETDAAFTAVFEDIPVYRITVVNGSGSTDLPGASMTTVIYADLPPSGKYFAGWQVNPAGSNLGTAFDSASMTPRVTLTSPASVTLTALYNDNRAGSRVTIR